MVKSGLPIAGKRVVVAGTGPLLLAVAAFLRKQGAEIPILCEQASWTNWHDSADAIGESKEVCSGAPTQARDGRQLFREYLAGGCYGRPS